MILLLDDLVNEIVLFERFQLIVSIVMALLPVLIWLKFISKRSRHEKRALTLVFLMGTLSVVPILGLQYLWGEIPALNVIDLIETSFENQNLMYLVLFMWVGVSEEFAKNLIVRSVDSNYIEIQTLNDAVRFSILAGLGFAFAENIIYFVNIWQHYGLAQLFVPFIFRSGFTAAGHMMFSGIYGYFYGLSKFSKPLLEEKRVTGKTIPFIGKLLGEGSATLYSKNLLLKGLLWSMLIHAVFNFLLQLNLVLPVVMITVTGFAFIIYLMRRKASHLVFTLYNPRPSTIGRRDEDVIVEVIGEQMKQKNYDKVKEICRRLLKRDPDNNVVKLLYAKAYDNVKMNNLWTNMKSLLKDIEDEKIEHVVESSMTDKDKEAVIELLSMWINEERYDDVMDAAKRMLSRDPNNPVVRDLMKKAKGKTKLKRLYESLADLFKDEFKEKSNKLR